MWLFTSKGFISATVSPVQTKRLQLRFRSFRQMAELDDEFSLTSDLKGKVFLTKRADYPCRIILKRKKFIRFMMALAASIDYKNFKNSVKDDPDYKHACGDTWRTMSDFQEKDTGFAAYGVRPVYKSDYRESTEFLSTFRDTETTPEPTGKEGCCKSCGNVGTVHHVDGWGEICSICETGVAYE